MKIKLKTDEIAYLLNENFLSENLRELFRNAEKSNPSMVILDINNDEADAFRDAFGERMQEVGFDEKYEPTSEGKILESLIDRFLN